jgi:hypothetical protein
MFITARTTPHPQQHTLAKVLSQASRITDTNRHLLHHQVQYLFTIYQDLPPAQAKSYDGQPLQTPSLPYRSIKQKHQF